MTSSSLLREVDDVFTAERRQGRAENECVAAKRFDMSLVVGGDMAS
jgi:hypothetical protein